MKTYIVPEDVLIGIVNYLATKPYSEVSQGIGALTKIIQEQKTIEPVPESQSLPEEGTDVA